MKLVAKTGKIKRNPELKNKLRWHIPKDEYDHGQLISAFLDMWMRHQSSKKVMKHFFNANINLDLILHHLFNSLLQSVLTLEQSIHILMNFMLEGQKLLFRMVYAVIKINGDSMLKIKSKQDCIEKIRKSCLSNINMKNLLEEAFVLSLKTSKDKFTKEVVNYQGNDLKAIKDRF